METLVIVSYTVLVVGMVTFVRPTWMLLVPTRRRAALVLVLAVFVSACGETTPTAPSLSDVPSTPPTPPAPPPSQVLSEWSVTVNGVSFNGPSKDACTEQAVRSLLGTPRPYSIRVTQTGSEVEVTLTSSAGEYDCTFTKAKSDSNGFTTRGTNGIYTCRTDFTTRNFPCSDGTQANLVTFGQDISGNVSGDEINGTWDIFWIDWSRNDDVGTRSEFTGHRR